MAVRRIIYAYYDPAWDKTTMSLAALTRTEVGPLEYTSEMRGHLHCPSCYESLIRVPSDPSISIMVDLKEALFRHLPDTDHTAPQCLLRSGIMVGKKYNSEEEALQAVEDEDIIIISGFMQERANNNARILPRVKTNKLRLTMRVKTDLHWMSQFLGMRDKPLMYPVK